MANQELVEKLISDKTLQTRWIIKAFRAVDRKDFVFPEDKGRAYEDWPLSIGYGATISQPTTVAVMLEKLQAGPGNRILEIGTGSGYLTALLAWITGKRGKVFSIEYIPELKGLAEFNLGKYNFRNAGLFVGDGKAGLEDYAPFDRIISSASGNEIPENWKNQLKTGGRIVAPVGENLVVLDKASKRRFKETEYRGFIFVPLR
ncbi:MAG: protein-L-isoaspartate O-methyltransferase [Parcubacteria group bacterium]|nr:protein-L-isoaspartate O-methyltransferase [Parcubacteria group bacterium]